MKKILGLDLGVTSIGWALITENEDQKNIVAMGSRIIPLSNDDKDEFSKGNAISKNQKRTLKRTQRKGYDRYQLRRANLTEALRSRNMLPDEALIKLPSLELWGLRAKAVSEKISLPELGRVLYHLNQKRGYKSSRSDKNLDKKDTEYVAEVKSRYQELKEQGQTIGQKFYRELKNNERYRIKQQVYPREAYIEEFDSICAQQKIHHPEIITEPFIHTLRNEIIYYQRKLKSQKGLVSVCEFEGLWVKNKQGKDVFKGPKVAHRSSPVFQVCKIWETLNSITLKNKLGETLKISIEKKNELFNHLNVTEKLSQAQLYGILGINKNDWYGNKQIERGIQGNLTVTAIKHAVKDLPFDEKLLTLTFQKQSADEKTYLCDRNTGEVLGETTKQIISNNLENEPLYQLWHMIYSIADENECKNALIKRFGISEETAEKLSGIDFTAAGFGNKSVKAIRNLLPYLMEGHVYSDAASYAGYNHSASLTAEENAARKLLEQIPNLEKNSLRQPVVEKILNQMINVVNSIIQVYGKPDEIRVELARELKQNKDERNNTFRNLTKRERENETIRKRIQDEYQLTPTRNNVIKWRLFHEINNVETKTNAICLYCGKGFGITDALNGSSVDVEHIIPKSLLFDDSQSNKTLAHRSCNEAKGNKTAFDFMQSKGEEELRRYIETVNLLYKKEIIGRSKKDKLLMPSEKIPKDFISRQLRETQYISRKSKEILEQVCRNVWSTSGSVTERLRRVWGWDDVLMNLQMPKYRELGLTEIKEWETNDGQKHRQEVIKDWTKRNDHRHHAVDALTVACTSQGFIHRINTLNSKKTRDEMKEAVDHSGLSYKHKLSLLDAYLISKKPFTTKQIEEKASQILVSFKAGKKVATIGKRKIFKNGQKQVVQEGIIIPRGALSEESVYGKIKTIEKNKPVKYLFENPSLIIKPYIRKLVEGRLKDHENDSKKALNSLKKEPIFLDKDKLKPLSYASCYKEEYVIKYPIESLKAKDVEYIIDQKVREIVRERLALFGNKEKEAFKDPLYFNKEKKILIRSVRMSTGLSAVEPVKSNDSGNPIGFVKPGNNHHIAIYIDQSGKRHEHICSFWDAVERKKYGIPVIIQNPLTLWETILNKKNEYPEALLLKLPDVNWKFEVSFEQNEMFILGMNDEEFEKAVKEDNNRLLSGYLYRTQKLTSGDYVFRHHLETEIIDTEESKLSKRYYRVRSILAFDSLFPKKVRINNIGQLVFNKMILSGIPINTGKPVNSDGAV